jgi:secondary thiamine-phosphate synthase enzyme
MPVKISLAGPRRKHVEAGFPEHHIAGGKVSPMRIAQTRLTIATAPREIKEITSEIASWAAGQQMRLGLLTVYIPHTSASLLIQENASPEVRRDLGDYLNRIVPEDPALYRHTDEGPDDMPAHIKSALTQTQSPIPVADGRLQLGTWQGIFLLEHRASPHRRTISLTLIGEDAGAASP